MPADEVKHGMDEETSRARTGPRHAAPRKPLFTRFQVPTGKAIALAAMPTAVLMGLGFTPTLALADGNDQGAPSSNSLTADEYKACVEAMADARRTRPSRPNLHLPRLTTASRTRRSPAPRRRPGTRARSRERTRTRPLRRIQVPTTRTTRPPVTTPPTATSPNPLRALPRPKARNRSARAPPSPPPPNRRGAACWRASATP